MIISSEKYCGSTSSQISPSVYTEANLMLKMSDSALVVRIGMMSSTGVWRLSTAVIADTQEAAAFITTLFVLASILISASLM